MATQYKQAAKIAKIGIDIIDPDDREKKVHVNIGEPVSEVIIDSDANLKSKSINLTLGSMDLAINLAYDLSSDKKVFLYHQLDIIPGTEEIKPEAFAATFETDSLMKRTNIGLGITSTSFSRTDMILSKEVKIYYDDSHNKPGLEEKIGNLIEPRSISVLSSCLIDNEKVWKNLLNNSFNYDQLIIHCHKTPTKLLEVYNRYNVSVSILVIVDSY